MNNCGLKTDMYYFNDKRRKVKRGSLSIDLVFSIFIISIISILVVSSVDNYRKMDKKIEDRIDFMNICNTICDEEKLEIEEYNGATKDIVKDEKNNKYDCEITKNRSVLDFRYGAIKSKITIKRGDLVEKRNVYSISGTRSSNPKTFNIR